VVTAPIHKEAWSLADIPWAGHTRLLASMTGARRVCMMLADAAITVSLVTTHTALRHVAPLVTSRRVSDVIELTRDALVRMGRADPRIAVCGLNPHAGEHGLFGDEETRHIAPAAASARRKGWRVEGPWPPDTAFLPERRRQTDGYVAMYHDQGLIPFKMLAFARGVNVTLGLPFVRTSPDHGTAFDLAWKGKASPSSLVQAVLLAARLSAAGM
jgi:4-hydroxythreonine-4-phosphate dehydrogenase